MRIKKLLYLVIIFVLLQDVVILNVYGNPVILYYFDPGFMAIIFGLLYIFSSLVEYAIILQFIKKYVINRRKFVGAILIINLITYPPTQGVVYIISLFTKTFFNYFVIIIEVFVIIIEYYLVKWQICKLIRSQFIDESIQPVKSKKVFLAVLISNTITFIIGLLFILPFYLRDLGII